MKYTETLTEKKQQVNLPDYSVVRKLKNRLFLGAVIFFSIITISFVFLLIGTLIVKGYHQINWSFFTQTPPDTFTAMMAKSSGELIPGGIVNGILGSLYIVALAIVLK